MVVMLWNDAGNEEDEQDEGICCIFRDGVLRIARGTGNCDKRAMLSIVQSTK